MANITEIGTLLMLVVSELGEAIEAHRNELSIIATLFLIFAGIALFRTNPRNK